eukprot:285290-Chlamydomonas_euryale.AAC.2
MRPASSSWATHASSCSLSMPPGPHMLAQTPSQTLSDAQTPAPCYPCTQADCAPFGASGSTRGA